METNLSEIEDAFMFISMGQPYEHMAYLFKETGKIYYHSEYTDDMDDLPEDIDDPVYVAIPHKRELGLGKNLALEFSYKFIKQKVEYVESIFRKKGAYSKFKNLLEQLGELDNWYQYEENAQRKALLEWCKDNGISVSSDQINEISNPTTEISTTLSENEKQKYLENTSIINWQHSAIIECSEKIMAKCNSKLEYTEKAFEYVRDKIKHSWDFKAQIVTCVASEVLENKTGYCYAKSHLLAALLRAQKNPTGFCYQRLSLEDKGPPNCLHGLNAVFLSQFGWYRIDARGNKEGVNAEFTPPVERLAFIVTEKLEKDLPEIWSDPLPLVVEALQSYKTIEELYKNLPDIQVL